MEIQPPSEIEYEITDGIYAKDKVIEGINKARKAIEENKPDKIITIGGSCIVSGASFDYLRGIYENVGIIWIDAHPDISTPKDYSNAHAMVLGTLMGKGDKALLNLMKNTPFKSDEILYVGLQEIHDYQEKFLKDMNVEYKIQTDEFLSNKEIEKFTSRFEHILIHLDIDVLDANLFHSTYFANKDLVGDGSGSGKMTIEKLYDIIKFITEKNNIVGFTIAEYLPFDEFKLNKMFRNIKIFND